MRHTPRKRFGQNFLKDALVIDRILQTINPQAKDNVLEIGPGLGALTLPLLRQVNRLTAVEIDRDLYQYLLEHPSTQNKLNLISADALTLDYSLFGMHLRVVGNLPYNISTPLLLHLLHYISHIDDMYFMLQKEVVERIAALPGTKHYGRLSIIIQYFCEVDHCFNVEPEAFNPRPKVESAIVRLSPYCMSPFDPVEKESLQRLVASSFAMRRKTLSNNLRKMISVSQLHDLGIDGSKRPEQITIAEYVQLAKFISK